MNNPNRKSLSFFKGYFYVLIGYGLTVAVFDVIHGRHFLRLDNLFNLIAVLIGCIIGRLLFKGYFEQQEVQSNLRLREIDPYATRPWREGWQEISQLKEKE